MLVLIWGMVFALFIHFLSEIIIDRHVEQFLVDGKLTVHEMYQGKTALFNRNGLACLSMLER